LNGGGLKLTMDSKNILAVIALGGNAIIREQDRGTIEEQIRNVTNSCDPIIDLIERGFRVVLTHGNGPQVGNSLLKSESAAQIVPPYPLDVCGAETQGLLGYIIQQSFRNRLKERGIDKEIVTVVTQVAVDKEDPAFRNPTKPIGPFYTKERAEQLSKATGAAIVEDSGRGYRRVVPSPKPKTIIERQTIKVLLDNDIIVVAVGGGGIPILEESTGLRGIEAVIDKDYASGVLARELGADYFIILTGVEKVSIDFGKPTQKDLSAISIADAKNYLAAGQFPPGSMGPKIEAAVDFIESGGESAIITSIDKLDEALKGKTGTRIIR